MKKFWGMLLGFLVLLFLCLAIYIIVIEGYAILSELDKTVAAALLTGFGIAITAIIAKYFEHKHTVEAQFRDDKVKLFHDFLVKFDELSEDSKGDDNGHMVEFIKDWQRKIIFQGGPNVLKNFFALKDGIGNIDTIRDMGNAMQLMGNLILSMRSDLGLSNRGINRQEFAVKWKLKHADLFLYSLKNNPSMKLKEYNEIEKSQDHEPGIS